MKKGFISMTIVYSFLLVFIFTLLALLLIYTQKSRQVDSIVNEAKEELYNAEIASGNNSTPEEPEDPIPPAPATVEDVSQWLNKKVRYVRNCSAGNSVDLINHWVEIEVMSGGTNVALGKTAVNDRNTEKTLYNAQYITDGRIDNVTSSSGYGYIQSDNSTYYSLECIAIDLGQEYTVDKITVWHYYLDNRAYYFDGTYVASNDHIYVQAIYVDSPETSSGKKIEKNVPYFDGYYAYEGQTIWYDGIINTGNSSRNTSATSWKNLAASYPTSGTVVNGTWGDNYLQLNGTNSWVNTGLVDNTSSKFSTDIEVVFSVSALPSEEKVLFGNFQNGGYGITLQSDGKLVGSYYSRSLNQYRKIYSDSAIVPNKKYTVAYTYGCQAVRNSNGDASTCAKHAVELYVNGVLQSDKITFSNTNYYNDDPGELKYAENNTVFAVGCDPNGTSCTGGYFAGKIYSVRYRMSRSTLPDGLYYNYIFDRNRFGS